MNRPKYFKDYFTKTSHNHEDEHLRYAADLENYCDELESSIKYILLHMQRDTLVDECEGCMCKWYCKGEKSVLQEWCEQMDSKLFKQDDLPNSTELHIKWEPEFKKLKEDHDKIMKALDKAYETICKRCGCYDCEIGCTMPSVDKVYACELERLKND